MIKWIDTDFGEKRILRGRRTLAEMKPKAVTRTLYKELERRVSR